MSSLSLHVLSDAVWFELGCLVQGPRLFGLSLHAVRKRLRNSGLRLPSLRRHVWSEPMAV